MVSVFACFGEWNIEDRWEFIVDVTRGGRMLIVEDDVRLENFVKMVCAEYDLGEDADSIDIGYELSENVMEKMPKGTPPVYVKTDSQLKIFLNIIKTDVVRLCVSKKKAFGSSSKRSSYGEGSYGDDNVDGDGYSFGDGYSGEDDNDGEDYRHYDNDEGESGDDEEQASDPPPYELRNARDVEGGEEGENEDRKGMTVAVVDVDDGHSSAYRGSIEVGDIFENKEQLIKQLRRLTILQNFDFDIRRSTTKLFVAKCFVGGCSWMIRSTLMSSQADDFIIRKLVDSHTCSTTMRFSRHRQATAKCIGELYFEKFGGSGLLKGIKPRNLMDTMKAVYGMEFEYYKAHAALRYARQLLRGSPEDGYSELPTYLHKIRKANPGTITKLECDEEHRFRYLFFAFGASVKGFEFLRKVVVVDGTHLYGKFKGVMLVAAGQDGNSNIFPLAFGIVDSENDGSWEWFFRQLRSVVGNASGLVFISDRHKSIGKAVAKVFPKAKRGICTYHLGQNVKSRFKGTTILNLFKKACKVGRLSEFTALFEVIRRQDPTLAEYLERADIQQWSRAHFNGDRYNIMTSNICESLNAVLKEAREFPIAFFVDHIRSMLGRWFSARKEAARLLEGLFSPHVEHMVADRTELARRLTVQSVDYTRCYITGGSFDCMVDLSQGTCTCRMFEIEKIPCEHAIAAARQRSIAVATLVHAYYSKGFLFATYLNSINPVDAALPVPPEVADQRCLPPLVKVPPGRPKKRRYQTLFEQGRRGGTKWKRQKSNVCS